MLSISLPFKGLGHSAYYLELAKEDYYLNGKSSKGKWHGKGAFSLGLKGTVKSKHFVYSMMGYSKNGKNKLTQNSGRRERISGWDLTFSVPKSVSVFWSQAHPNVRKVLEKCHEKAVMEALNYVEREAGISRRGKAGIIFEQVGLAFALFQHGTSREGDPNLHTHCVLMNICKRNDHTTGSLYSKFLYTHKMSTGALYRIELGKQLTKKLGLKLTKNKSWFEIDGVSQGLIDHFSKRSKQIKTEIEKKGQLSAKAKNVATLKTRRKKENINIEKLFETWQKIGKIFSWTKENVQKLLFREQAKELRISQNSFDEIVRSITISDAYFQKKDIIRKIAEEYQGQHISCKQMLLQIEQGVARSKQLVKLGLRKNYEIFSTKEVIKTEKELFQNIEKLSLRRSHPVGIFSQGDLARKNNLSGETKRGYEYLTNIGSIKILTGYAGTGKSRALKYANLAWQKMGYNVHGMSLAGKAADSLQFASNINSQTIHSFIYEIGTNQKFLNEKSILVVDEAGMVGTRQLKEISKIALKARAKLVLVGDYKQLQAINLGGAFEQIAKKFGSIQFQNIKRQEKEWMKRSVKNLSDGFGSKAILEYKKRGKFHVGEDKFEAVEKIVNIWNERKAYLKPTENLILASEKRDVSLINKQIQSSLIQSKFIKDDEYMSIDKYTIHKNDKIVFTKNSKKYDLRNGEFGIVKSINLKKSELIIKKERGKTIKIKVSDYSNIELGYATTTHKAQGITIKNSFVLMSGAMQDKEMSYVQLSRAKRNCEIFTTELDLGEEELELLRKVERSRKKEMVRELVLTR